MNKKGEAEKGVNSDKQANLFRLIEDYSSSIRKYEKSLLEGECFSPQEIQQQLGFLKTLFAKLEKHKTKQASKYFSQLKHIEFVLKQLGKTTTPQERGNNDASIQLKKQAMIIEQQDQEIRRLIRYSSSASLDEGECERSERLGWGREEELERMRQAVDEITRENRELRDTNRMLMGRLNIASRNLNLKGIHYANSSNTPEEREDWREKEQLLSRGTQSLRTSIHSKLFSQEDDYLSVEALKSQNSKLTSRIQQLSQQVMQLKKQNDVLKEKYLRSKHNITRMDSSEDILKRRGSLQSIQSIQSKECRDGVKMEEVKGEKERKIRTLNDLKSLVQNHRVGIEGRNDLNVH